MSNRMKDGPPAVVRGALRGMVAAMAMTGMRTVTANTATEEKPPPQLIVDKHAPAPIARLPREHRAAVTELLHWAYGAGGGALFGLLPGRIRRQGWVGPAYGLAFWIVFELGVAPALGVERYHRRRVAWPALVALDHVLYGLVVADRLAPDPEREPRRK